LREGRMDEINHEYTEEIVCPWCGYEFSDSWEWSDYDDNEKCPKCNKSFSYERIVSCEYSTKRTRCKSKDCRYTLEERFSDNPYIYNNKNWTIWECEICKDHVVKVSKYVGDKPRLELPVMSDFV
jgi:hypothetical protein